MESSQRRWLALRTLAAGQHGVFALAQVDRLQIPRGTVRRWAGEGRLEQLTHGAYGFASLLGPWSYHAAICTTVPSAAVSHRAAATWWALDPFDHEAQPATELSVPEHRATRRLPLHRTCSLRPGDVRQAGVLRITAPARTLVDLAGVLHRDELERVVESALRRQLVSVADVRARAEYLQARGRSGPGPLLDLLDRRIPGLPVTGSDAELRFLQLLRRAGVEEPIRQYRVTLPSGPAYLDVAWPDLCVFAEIDGFAFHSDRPAFQRDRTRQNELVLLGLTPLRFTVADIDRRPAWVIATVRQALADAVLRRESRAC